MGLNPSNMLIAPIWKAELADALENWFIPKTLLYPDKFEWYTNWEAVLKTGNISIGGIAMGYPNKNGEAETGYSFDQNHQNKGYGTEALKRICEWGFMNPDVKTIKAQTDVDNYASQRILLKACFKHTDTNEAGRFVFKLPRK